MVIMPTVYQYQKKLERKPFTLVDEMLLNHETLCKSKKMQP